MAEPARTRALGVFSVAMLSVAAAFSVRNLPSMAVEGWSLIVWYALATALFLLPLALTSAELAAAWPKAGGPYAWVREAFGTRTGFMALWSIVANNQPWYPTVLAFVVASLAYGFDPDAAKHRVLVAAAMIATFWVVTAFALAGPLIAARLSVAAAVAGTIVPSVLLIAAGIAWAAAGRHGALPPFAWHLLAPGWGADRLPFVSSMLLAFAGLEACGYYVLQVREPRRDFPKAIGLALATIFALSVLSTLAIASTIPREAISLSGGVLQAFAAIFRELGVPWATPLVAVLVVLGALALLCTWVLGPFIALGAVADDGLLPAIFARRDARGAPAAVLLWQAAIVSALAAAFALVPSVNDAYWMLSATVTALLGFFYLPMFAAVIRLRYTQPATPRPFEIPGGLPGAWLFAGVGFAATAFAVIVSLEKPANVTFVSGAVYVVALIAFALLWMIPWAIFSFSRRRRPTASPGPASRTLETR